MDIQRIKFERTGGFAGLRLAAEFELDDLPEDQSHRLRELLDDLDFDEFKDYRPENTAMDGFHYLITVSGEEKQYTIETNDDQSNEKLSALIALFNQVLRAQARKKKEN